jgi:outer membrane murein-binding lipoprotein Lpp
LESVERRLTWPRKTRERAHFLSATRLGFSDSIRRMAAAADALPEDIDALKAALVAARALASQAAQERDETAAELAVARATASEDVRRRMI